jgi:hypothetical protein
VVFNEDLSQLVVSKHVTFDDSLSKEVHLVSVAISQPNIQPTPKPVYANSEAIPSPAPVEPVNTTTTESVISLMLAVSGKNSL